MESEYKGAVEGLLFASGDEGITPKQMAKVLDVSQDMIIQLLNELMVDYENVNRGMMIMKSNDIFHLTTKPEHNMYYKRLMAEPRSTRMSQAVLETLAIIAYRQPITRVEMEEIRGVNSDYAVQTLLSRSLIESVGKKESIGRPILFGTTKEFLTYFGLTSLEELPALSEQVDDKSVAKETDLFFNHSISSTFEK